MENAQNALFKAVYRLLKPLVRLLLRNGVPYGALADLVKKAYVDVAFEDFGVPGRKASDSRVATITGLTRKDVSRVKEITDVYEEVDIQKYHRAGRVVYGWVHDARYHTAGGDCAALPLDGADVSFAQLVKTYSGDVPTRAILDELLQAGVVERTGDEKILLLKRAYIPATSETEKLRILGTDVSGLIETIDRNIYQKGKAPFFQRKVFYDNLPAEYIPELQAMINEKAQELLEKVDKDMASHDRDVNPIAGGSGRKAVGIGIYYFEDKDFEEKSS